MRVSGQGLAAPKSSRKLPETPGAARRAKRPHRKHLFYPGAAAPAAQAPLESHKNCSDSGWLRQSGQTHMELHPKPLPASSRFRRRRRPGPRGPKELVPGYLLRKFRDDETMGTEKGELAPSPLPLSRKRERGKWQTRSSGPDAPTSKAQAQVPQASACDQHRAIREKAGVSPPGPCGGVARWREY